MTGDAAAVPVPSAEEGGEPQAATGHDGGHDGGHGGGHAVEGAGARAAGVPRLVMVVLAAELGKPASGHVLYRKLRREGVLLDHVDPAGGMEALRMQVQARAVKGQGEYAHWMIDGGAARAADGVASVGYGSLAPVRERLLGRARNAMSGDAARSGPEELRTLMAHLTPEAAGMAADRDPVMAHFELALLTEGSGTQIFSTTFVQWAVRECLRRAHPTTLLARWDATAAGAGDERAAEWSAECGGRCGGIAGGCGPGCVVHVAESAALAGGGEFAICGVAGGEFDRGGGGAGAAAWLHGEYADDDGAGVAAACVSSGFVYFEFVEREIVAMAKRRWILAVAVNAFSAALILGQVSAAAHPAPQVVAKDGRHALMVDGAPYLVLGAQINNSSSWASTLPTVWPALEAMHANTVEAPVYWEQMEATPGKFDFSTVDLLVNGAREHHLHLIVLWFGTWKNGNMHYVPKWVKTDTAKYPRVINAAGEPIDVLSAIGHNTMEADKTAFAALMGHLAEIDSSEHTVLMVQVENESGIVGSPRDFSAAATKEFDGQVPAGLLKVMAKKPGTWREVFAGKADETFQAYLQSRYINEIAAAGKKAFNIPLYCNVWVSYPVQELPERQVPNPGIGYPSGGPVQDMLPLWKAFAPSIDLIGPDIYSSDRKFYTKILETYNRPDNALWIPETGNGDGLCAVLFPGAGAWGDRVQPVWCGPDRVDVQGAGWAQGTHGKLWSAGTDGPGDCQAEL